MLFSSKLDKNDMDLERQVICEEINMYEDEPEELVNDLIMESAFGDSSLGRSILGTKESLSGINSENMREYLNTHYTSKNMVISVSGHFDDSIFQLFEKYFGSRRISDNEVKIHDASYLSGNKILRKKESEQIQLIAGFNSIDVKDDRVYSLLTFNNVFGGGMSSRLFQNIREKEGLVYSIYAYHAAYINTGIFSVSTGMAANNLNRVCELISDEIKRIKRDKLTEDEINRAKEQLKGNYILSYESIGARMQAAGRNLLLNRPIISSEEVIEKINNVSKDSICDIIETVLDTKTLSLAAVGPIDSIDNLFDF